jgi:hypothetical protein
VLAEHGVPIAPSSYRAARTRAPSSRALSDAALGEVIGAFIVRRLAVDKATVSAVAREPGRTWDTVATSWSKRPPPARPTDRPPSSSSVTDLRGCWTWCPAAPQQP